MAHFPDRRGRITGSGRNTTESREVSGFDQIVFRSEGRMIVTVGGSDSLVIESDDNLQPFLLASVGGGKLEISTSVGTDIDPSKPPVFRIGMAAIASVDLAGAGTLEITSVETDRQEVRVAGVTIYEAANLESRTAAIDGAGTGQATIWVTDGET